VASVGAGQGVNEATQQVVRKQLQLQPTILVARRRSVLGTREARRLNKIQEEMCGPEWALPQTPRDIIYDPPHPGETDPEPEYED
jgi:hypothetical protein